MAQSEIALPPTGEWECVECGHILAGLESHRPSKCPECEAPANALEFFPYDEDSIGTWDRGEIEDEDEEEYEDEPEADEYEEP